MARLTHAEKCAIAAKAMEPLERRPDGLYNIEEVWPLVDKLMPKFDENVERRRRSMLLLEQVSQERAFTNGSPGEVGFFGPGGTWIRVDPDRFIKGANGGIVSYMKARPPALYEESKREVKHADEATTRAEAKAILCDDVRAWERRKLKVGWNAEQITMEAYHKENPLQPQPGSNTEPRIMRRTLRTE